MRDTHREDLDTARYLASCGVPIFLAKPSNDHASGTGYTLPARWQTTEPDPSVLDDYEPGMAVCAVMGHTVDGVDLDPRSGGALPAEHTPRSYGRQRTPSGGTHDLVAPLGVGSKDGLFPGVDVKAGREDGSGRGFLFIAPTERVSKETGERTRYEWEVRPDLDELQLIGDDDSGRLLAERVQGGQRESGPTRGYVGPTFAELSSGQQGMAKTHLDEKIEYWADLLQDARTWPEGETDHKGRGWEALTRDFAWAVASYAATDWMPLTDSEAEALYAATLPPELAQDSKCRGKWYEGIVEKAGEHGADSPPWSDFQQVEETISTSYNIPTSLDETGVAEWLVHSGLGLTLAHSGGLGWLVWDGGRWRPTRQEVVKAKVLHAVKMVNHRAQDLGLDKDVIKRLTGYKTESKTRALTELVKVLVADDQENYDARADLLNVANGVVDLRTGRLLPHDPIYRFTKITPVGYDPSASTPDFDQVLSALEPEVRDWMQIRFGQAATGHMTSDDVMPIGIGGGSNGKTTLITVIRNAMGDFQVTVPNKLILGNPSDHPTELTMLMGARMAFIDETPEGRNLNVGQVKTLLGTDRISARKIAKDTVTWKSTHSLFLMTNHLPRVTENDHGTTRRLALVRFDKKFPRDDSFRARVIEQDSHVTAAALAWIVEGARRWYALGGSIPPAPVKVKADTEEWLRTSDPTNDYIEDRFVLDWDSVVLVKEINEDLNVWLELHSMRTWGATLSASRLSQSALFQDHGLKPVRATKTRALVDQLDMRTDTEIPPKPMVYRGIRWRRTDEEMGFDPAEVRVPDTVEELL